MTKLSPKAMSDLRSIAAHVPKDELKNTQVTAYYDRVVQRHVQSAATKSGLSRSDLNALDKELYAFLQPVYAAVASGKGDLKPAHDLADALGLELPGNIDQSGMFGHAMAAIKAGVSDAARSGLGSRWADVD